MARASSQYKPAIEMQIRASACIIPLKPIGVSGNVRAEIIAYIKSAVSNSL